MDNFNDFGDLDFEQLEREIVRVKKTLYRLEKNTYLYSINYFEKTKKHIALINIIAFIGFVTYSFLNHPMSLYLLAIPLINFLIMAYFDHSAYLNIKNLRKIDTIGDFDIYDDKKLNKIVLLKEFSILSTFLSSIVFVFLFFSLMIN